MTEFALPQQAFGVLAPSLKPQKQSLQPSIANVDVYDLHLSPTLHVASLAMSGFKGAVKSKLWKTRLRTSPRYM